MTRKNADQIRWCENCKTWFIMGDKRSRDFVRCPSCRKYPKNARCNRCGYEWGLSASQYPNNCSKCKSPYFNRRRTNDIKPKEASE